MAHMGKLDDSLQELIFYFHCMSRESGSQAWQQAISAVLNNRFILWFQNVTKQQYIYEYIITDILYLELIMIITNLSMKQADICWGLNVKCS